jgi:hypothetical protein
LRAGIEGAHPARSASLQGREAARAERTDADERSASFEALCNSVSPMQFAEEVHSFTPIEHIDRRRRSMKALQWIYGALALAAPASALAGSELSNSTTYGSNACPTTPDSQYSTCIGASAGAANTGFGNVLLGTESGASNTNGNYNTYIGSLSGASNATGSGNTFLGYLTGWLYTAGDSNTFIGEAAGEGVINGAASGSFNTFIGSGSGQNNTNGTDNVFVGRQAGNKNATGNNNTFVGNYAGLSSNGVYNGGIGIYAGHANTTGSYNSYLGSQSGANNVVGSGNVFVGNAAGYTETGSNKLYIDNCMNGSPCTPPFIYGEFDNHLLRINGVVNVAANGVSQSQLHFSLANADSGGFLTSVLENNFFMSSGARYSGSNWVQRSSDGQAVIQGSGSVGYRIFTATGHSVGTSFTPTTRLHIDYSGQFGINTAPVGGHEIHTLTGAYEMSGTWVNGSSRELKDRIAPLSADAATQALASLEPVTFVYKTDSGQPRVGFIAEDVPELVAMKDRKGLSPMDIVAVLTKVVQQQRQQLATQHRKLLEQEGKLEAERAHGESMEGRLREIAAQLARLEAH